MIGMVLNDRYRLDAELGRGGMGVVYRAHDTLLERDVAVKVMSATVLGTEGRARLMHEARATAKLNHPNIVSVYDAGETEMVAHSGTVPFIVMELVRGESLHRRRPESLDETISIARQVCAALEHAHAHGIIHRDLKPENVMILPDGTAKLMDFGLARSVASRLTTEGALVGTVFYLAPEQALGDKIDPRVDLYALGVTLYELTTGVLPFTADDPFVVITQHLRAPVVPPRAKNPEIPLALNALIVQLLSKAPQDRPASAAEVRETLEGLESGEEKSVATPEVIEEPSVLDRIVRGRLVGRKRELAEARTLWGKAASGQGQTLLISGEPGIGKTRLMRELVTQAEVTGGKALVGECFAQGGAPYAPIAQMIRSVLDNGFGFELPDLVLADLITIAPDLRARFPDVPPNPSLDPQSAQQRLFESVVVLCHKLTDQAPLLLCLDDVHWADSGTLYLMRYLARRLSQRPAMLVATYREIELDDTHPFQGVLVDLNRARLANRLKLVHLSRGETEAMLAALFAEEITPEFLDGIYRETEGNPFFIEEVCKALVESGKLYFKDGIWHRPSVDELEIPQSIRVAIQSRVAKLSANVQKMLQLAAVIGHEFDFQTLIQLSEMDEDALIDALEIAHGVQLIEELRAGRGERFAFVHTLIPSALRENLSRLRRGRLHQKVAAAIERLRPEDYESLAFHYGEARDEERALVNIIKAADQARKVYASEDAIRYYTEALELIPKDHPGRVDLLASRVKVFALLARREEQLADIEEMLSLAEKQGDGTCELDAVLALTDYHLATEWHYARGLAERLAEMAERLDDPVQEGYTLQCIGRIAPYMGHHQQGREALEKAITLFKNNGYPGEAAACLNTLRGILATTGKCIEAQKAAEEALALSREADDRKQEAESLRSMAFSYSDQNQPGKALPLAEAALELHRQLGDLAGESTTLQALGNILLELRRPDEAIAYYRQSLELAEAIGFDLVTRYAGLDLLNTRFRIPGEYQPGVVFLDERLAIARSAKDRLLDVAFMYNKLEMLEYLGLYDEALRVVNDILPIAKEIKFPTAWFISWIGRLQALLGQREEALRSLNTSLKHEENEGDVLFNMAFVAWLSADQEEWLTGLGNARSAVKIWREQGGEFRLRLAFALDIAARLYLALGEDENALECTKEVMQLVEADPRIYGHEQFYFTHSRALRAAGQHKEANKALRRAYEWVMRIAEQTSDKAWRKSWLENVRYNREIVAETRERGIAN